MHYILSGKKVIFFDIGCTLDRPASGDWMFTNKFLSLAGERLRERDSKSIAAARRLGIEYLADHQLMRDVDEENEVFTKYYSILSESLGLGLSGEDCRAVAEDRSGNMENYVIYPDAKAVPECLSRRFTLGLISDTSPSVDAQLRYLGISQFFSFRTYSFELGVFKPDAKMFLDALAKAGCPAEETVFIDDVPQNLAAAAALGITPVLIAAEKEPPAPLPCTVIRSLSELTE